MLGRYGSGSQSDVSLNAEKSGGLKEEGNYYTQLYKVSSDFEISQYTITSTKGMPTGSYIADTSGNKKTTFKASENFKIYIPKSSMSSDINITIAIDGKLKSYPVFYGEAPESTLQDYAVTYDPYTNEQAIAKLSIKTNTAKLSIVKTDKETGKALSGVTFNAKYLDGTNIGNFTTDKNGKITISNLRQGKVVLTEVSTQNEYILNTTPVSVSLEYNETKSIEITNEHKKGNLKIVKVDKDDNDLTLGAVEFDLVDSSGKVVKHLVTDVNGVVEIKNINTGNYTLRETLTKKEYNLAVDQDVVVNWNETMEIKVENEKKKGQIEVYKVDAEDKEIKLEGVEFQVINANNEVIETIVTNSEGYAITSRIPIGEYRY